VGIPEQGENYKRKREKVERSRGWGGLRSNGVKFGPTKINRNIISCNYIASLTLPFFIPHNKFENMHLFDEL
jgi:hypothetical protein